MAEVSRSDLDLVNQMLIKTYDQARDEVRAIRLRCPGTYTTMRHEAAQDLEAQMRERYGEDHGEGIGSSDVSIHVIEMYRTGELEV